MVERGRCAGFVAFDAIRAPQVFESVHVSALRTAAGILAQAFARHEAQRELAFRARHDALTGVGSRWLFREELGGVLDDHRRRGAGLAVLLVDLDRLKMVNDSLGHGAGDDLLVSVASRVSTAALPGELVARLGGDELAVLCPDLASAEEALRRAAELQELLETPVVVAGHDVVMTASVGVVFVAGDHDAVGADEVLHRADVAMYAAKERGRNRVELFDTPLRERAASRLRQERELRQAVDEGRFVVHYQAEFDLATGAVVGAEALVRWNHPERGLVVAGEFVPLAEETGVILDLGLFVLAEACRQLGAWQRSRPDREMVVRVNLSARQVAQPDLVDQVVAVLAETGVEPAALCLEITETTLMADADLSLEVLARLKHLGIRLAVDDFGTGYSSLAYLRRFPVDVVKIDRSFVAGLGGDPDDTAIVSAILHLAEALGLGTTAEGVETPGQLAELRRLGCRRAQGFLLARPEAPAALAQRW
jgi:diguanylate cyclase (GGDEF)-like protein